jgi:16S rRNA (cytosine967-C5)-methyltransferase
MTARDIARAVLARVERGGWATPSLGAALATSGLDARDRRLASELTYGVLRHQARLDRALAAYADTARTPPAVIIALRVAAYQLLVLDRIPPHAAVDDAASAARAVGGVKLAGFANAVLRRLAAAGEPPLPAGDRRRRLELEWSMPRWMIDLVEAALAGDAAEADPDDLAHAIKAMNTAPPLWLRVNIRKTTRDAIAAELATVLGEVPTGSALADAALDATGLADPESSAPVAQGRATVQDLGAQLVGALVDAAPGMRILDACAGHGGKATHQAELTDDRASIDAVDPGADKLRRLAASARRLGLTSIRTITGALATAPGLAEHYDRVLLDAPCTGLGVLRRHPEAKWRLVPADVERAVATQAGLLDVAATRVAIGGTLTYAVCSVTVAEGPAQIAGFLARHPGFAIEAPTGPRWDGLVDGQGAVRLWPHRHRADGFYAVRMIRRG